MIGRRRPCPSFCVRGVGPRSLEDHNGLWVCEAGHWGVGGRLQGIPVRPGNALGPPGGPWCSEGPRGPRGTLGGTR